MAATVRAISIFDLDRTLTRRRTYLLFLVGAAAWHRPLRLVFVPVVAVAMILHAIGLVPRKALKELMQALLLGRRIGRDRLARLADGFVTRLLRDGLHTEGLQRLREDRAQGRLLVLATAAPDYYAEAIAARLGMDATICTRCRRDGDAVLARIDGPNCYGYDKLRAIEAWLAAQGLARGDVHVRFYSDDRSDLPVFEWADEPVVVNARRPLLALAARRGWPAVNWRSPAGATAP